MKFATKDAPIRCSALPRLVRCPLQTVLELRETPEPSGEAADTGTAVHFAVRSWHTHAKGDSALAAAAMRAATARFPLADVDKAEVQFQWYCKDPRNLRAEIVLCEKEIVFTLPPAESDPTQEAIYVTGTMDQVRRERGNLYLWDIKTGSPEGMDMVNAAALQLAAYQFGASNLLGETIRGAGVIRTKDYVKTDYTRKTRKPGPVFYEAPWNPADVLVLLRSVQETVADIRAGRVTARPGEEACKWCRFGLGTCLREVKTICSAG